MFIKALTWGTESEAFRRASGGLTYASWIRQEWHRRIPEYRIKPGETPSYSPGIREVLYLPLVWDV